MAQQSNIEWTDATWNPWHGCEKISPGCKFCYMYRDKDRFGLDPRIVQRSKSRFNDPLIWASWLDNQTRAIRGKDLLISPGSRIFTCSWSDFFIEKADLWRDEAWEIIKKTPMFTYQILTKRPERIGQHLPMGFYRGSYDHVWLGISAETLVHLKSRTDTLITQTDSNYVRFLSAEPLLGPMNINNGADNDIAVFDWVIIGGESGNEAGPWRYRPCELKWIEDLIDICQGLNIPVFVKQLGTHLAKEMGLSDRHGRNWNEWPEHLRVREFPTI